MSNPFIYVPLTAYVVAQLTKFLLKTFRGNFDLKYLYASGGMPSVHSAVVVALAVTASLREGVESSTFGLAVVMAGIVMYDSFGVRRSSGEQAAALNALVDSLVEAKVRFERPHKKRLREILGHTPAEVAIGAVMGGAIALLYHVDMLQDQLEWLSNSPSAAEVLTLAVVCGLLIFGGWGLRFWQARFKKKSEIWLGIAKSVLVKTQVLGWTGLLVAFSQREQAPVLGIRLWTLALLIALIAWDIYVYSKYITKLPAALEAEKEADRKKKWFKLARKKH